VGCTKSKDGKNWSFEGATGYIYLPATKPASGKLKRIVIRTLADPSWQADHSVQDRQFFFGRILAGVAGESWTMTSPWSSTRRSRAKKERI